MKNLIIASLAVFITPAICATFQNRHKAFRFIADSVYDNYFGGIYLGISIVVLYYILEIF